MGFNWREHERILQIDKKEIRRMVRDSTEVQKAGDRLRQLIRIQAMDLNRARQLKRRAEDASDEKSRKRLEETAAELKDTALKVGPRIKAAEQELITKVEDAESFAKTIVWTFPRDHESRPFAHA